MTQFILKQIKGQSWLYIDKRSHVKICPVQKACVGEMEGYRFNCTMMLRKAIWEKNFSKVAKILRLAQNYLKT